MSTGSGSVGIGMLTGGAAESLVGPATEAGKGIYNCLKHKYECIKNLDKNFEKLEREVRYLSSRAKDVKERIDMSQGMEMTHECATWLEDVESMMENQEDLKTRYQNSSNSSYAPYHLRTRLKLSKESEDMITSVVDLRDRYKLIPEFLIERHRNGVANRIAKKINDFPSQRGKLETLLSYLKNDTLKKIGIWGLPGVGKTTILETVYDEVRKLQIFDYVLWVTVSERESVEQYIQQTILKQLGKSGGIHSESQAAALISKLLESKKFLILLDEVFSEIDLSLIGIDDSHVQGKVVLATRERVLCKSMMTDEEIKVEKLSRDEAHKLFRDVVGITVDHPCIKPIAELVLKQCGELPQIIRAVGMRLRDKINEDVWNNALSELQSPNTWPLEYMEDVFSCFKLIYEGLSSDKHCLLYGAAFPEDHEIYRDYMIECWKAEKLIGIGKTLKTTRQAGHALLGSFIDNCIFDKCRSTKYVKMPIIFRNFAMRMAEQHKFGLLFRGVEEIENRDLEEKRKNARVISWMNSQLDELPDMSKYPMPMASSLFLQKNHILSTIPTSLFKCISTLKILDLYRTGIRGLPPSISNLTILTSLYLNGCNQLMGLPEEIGELQHLEILDIRRTGIPGLPVVIGRLTCLLCLRVSFTSDNQNHVEANGMEIIPSKTIEQLVKLEELSVDADLEKHRWNQIAPKIVEQLAKLKKLTTLSFYFPTIESLEDFTECDSWSVNDFRCFNIYVGSYSNPFEFDISNCTAPRYLQYSGGTDIPNGIKEVLSRACAFELKGHQNITNFTEFGIDRMESLEICIVEGCNSNTTIIDSNSTVTCAFPWLKELHLSKLERLNKICQSPISPESFARLTTLTLCDCPSVIKVVSKEIAQQLRELQHLKVENCSQVTEIIEMDSHSSGFSAFPKLKMLELIRLECLVRIHSHDLFDWQALHQIEIIKCDRLANICLNTVNATKLRCIRCSEAWWGALTLSDEVRAHLGGFCCFI